MKRSFSLFVMYILINAHLFAKTSLHIQMNNNICTKNKDPTINSLVILL